jgi:hypothetical protein
MSATSLLLYNNNINDPYDQVNAASPVPSDWISLTPFKISPSPTNVSSWISLYQPLQFDLQSLNDKSNYKGPRLVYDTLKSSLPYGSPHMVLNIIGTW